MYTCACAPVGPPYMLSVDSAAWRSELPFAWSRGDVFRTLLRVEEVKAPHHAGERARLQGRSFADPAIWARGRENQ
eukprot:16441607-Heterocapsa_arctica.AAC.1